MKKADPKSQVKDVAPVTTEPPEPEVPQFGNGRFEYKDLTTYVGNWRIFGGYKLKHGHGKIVYPGSQSKGQEEYEGDWQEDKMHGSGKYNFTSGAVYSGEWVKGKMSGKGKMVNIDGTSYEGDWLDGVMHGEGVYIDADKVRWEGVFIHGCYDSKIQKKLKVEKEIGDKLKDY